MLLVSWFKISAVSKALKKGPYTFASPNNKTQDYDAEIRLGIHMTKRHFAPSTSPIFLLSTLQLLQHKPQSSVPYRNAN